MTEELRLPLVPAEVDLRGYEFMPLYGDRLFKSETWIAASPEAKVAALRLWWHAYGHEMPAGSLPDNDSLLADYAGYGVILKAWRKIKPQAMRGWALCSDGRWYHPFLATLVLEGWEKRLQSDETAEAKQTRQQRWRDRCKQLSQQLRDVGITPPRGASLETLERLLNGHVVSSQSSTKASTGDGVEIGKKGQDRTGQDIKTQDQKPPLRVAEPIFGEWIEFLQGKGVKEASARTFIGLMRKGYGDELVVEVMAEAERQDITNPKSWISRALQVRSTKRGQTIENREPSQTAQGVALLESMKERG